MSILLPTRSITVTSLILAGVLIGGPIVGASAAYADEAPVAPTASESTAATETSTVTPEASAAPAVADEATSEATPAPSTSPSDTATPVHTPEPAPVQTSSPTPSANLASPAIPDPAAPSEVQNITVKRSTTQTGVVISWDAPVSDGGDPITSYKVTTEGDTSPTETIITDGSTSADIAIPINENTVATITATNNVGTSVPVQSASFYVRAVAPNAPENPTITVSNQTATQATLDLNWAPPAYDGGAGIYSYRIILTDDNGNSYFFNPTNDTHATQDVYYAAGRTYTLAVTVDNFYGTSDQAKSTPVTLDTTAPATTSDLKAVYNYKAHTVAIQFYGSNFDGGTPVTSYTIKLLDEEGTVVQTLRLPADAGLDGNPTYYARYIPLNGASGKTYTVQVVATNAKGDSPEATSNAILVPSADSVPPAPTEEQLNNLQPLYGPAADGSGFFTTEGSKITGDFSSRYGTDLSFGPDLYAYSGDTALGWATIDADGKVTWDVAGLSLTAGSHPIVLIDRFGNFIGTAEFTYTGDPTTETPGDGGSTGPGNGTGGGSTGGNGGTGTGGNGSGGGTGTGEGNTGTGNGSTGGTGTIGTNPIENGTPIISTPSQPVTTVAGITAVQPHKLAWTGSDPSGAAKGGLGLLVLGFILLVGTKILRRKKA